MKARTIKVVLLSIVILGLMSWTGIVYAASNIDPTIVLLLSVLHTIVIISAFLIGWLCKKEENSNVYHHLAK